MADRTTEVRESERKFELDPADPLPDVSAVDGISRVDAPVETTLEATYFDTPRRSLTERGVTLRRRSGGEDAGWHLKRPMAGGTADDRTELQMPLEAARSRKGGNGARPEVPAELADQVAALVRGQELEPIARIRTHRVERLLLDDSGDALASLVDDEVDVQPASGRGAPADARTWREVEVELVHGDAALLDRVSEALLAAGLRRSPWPSKLRHALDVLEEPGRVQPADRSRVEVGVDGPDGSAGMVVLAHLREQVEKLIAEDPRVRVDAPDAVHAMRVATRRLRSALATFRPLFDRARTDPIRDELKWLGSVLGPARDAEVLRDRFLGAARQLDPDLRLGPVTDRIDTEMRRRHEDARREIERVLGESRYFALLDVLDELVLAPPFEPEAHRRGKRQLARLVTRSCRRVERAAKVVEEEDDDADRRVALHELRKAAKRARYAAEAVDAAGSPLEGKRAACLATRMEDLQDLLGEHQDSVEAQPVLRELGVAAHLAGENGFSFGILHEGERRDRARVLTDLGRTRRRARSAADSFAS